ncbi:MAG: hypothetical protein R3B06_22350 [Kofleriaceae bacterium]
MQEPRLRAQLRADGKPWRPSRTVGAGRLAGFEISYQRADGALWQRLMTAGVPVRVSCSVSVSVAAFERAVGGRPGAYLLIPVDRDGRRCGNITDPLFVGDDGQLVLEVPPPGASPVLLPVRDRGAAVQPDDVGPSDDAVTDAPDDGTPLG